MEPTIIDRYLQIRADLRGHDTADLSLVASNILIAEAVERAATFGITVRFENGEYPIGVTLIGKR